ncbi:MAG: NAD-dependent epimerase/dehydratase family protein [Bacteroidota bacterium]
MIKVGITGQSGFVGTHLFNYLRLDPDHYYLIPFEDAFFDDPAVLADWAAKCDAIVHLAALNRHNDPDEIYQTNLRLVKELISALEQSGSKPHLLFSGSTQEMADNPYGRSKKKGRELLMQWAERSGGKFTGLVIPNVFGPFGHPYYNSVVATFCHQLNHGEEPAIHVDQLLRLVYVGELTKVMGECILQGTPAPEYRVPHTSEMMVSEILQLLKGYKAGYAGKGELPQLKNAFEINLFNTFRCFMDIPRHFPVLLNEHADERGSFVETMRLGVGGQVSFSKTKPGITRGNHFHTRKIERFVVIRGQAVIRLRRIGTGEVLEFRLDGAHPSYVDMPVWYTHNITNAGDDELYTLFWINEFFDPDDPDTFFETV